MSNVKQKNETDPGLWFDGNAEEVAAFCISILPNASTARVLKAPIDMPSGPAGSVLTVAFTLA